MPAPPTYPSPAIPQEPIFPRFQTIYFAKYVQKQASVVVLTYNRTTKAWTVTPAGANLVSINSSDADQTSLSINGYPSLFVWNATGEVGCGTLTNRVVLGKVPRLDFYRQNDSIPLRFASLSQFGALSVLGIGQHTAPTGTDRMYLLGNPLCSIGVDGLLCPAIVQLAFLKDAHSSSSYFLEDQASRLLTHR